MGRPDSAEEEDWVPTTASFLSSPPRNSVTVVLGQHFFNRTTDVTQTFGIEKYVPYSLYSVFNPSNHDLGELRASAGWGVVCVPQTRTQMRARNTRGKVRCQRCFVLGLLGHQPPTPCPFYGTACHVFLSVEADPWPPSFLVLIRLKKKGDRCAVRSQFVQPICLPEAGSSFPTGQKCQIAGWGHIKESEWGAAPGSPWWGARQCEPARPKSAVFHRCQ